MNIDTGYLKTAIKSIQILAAIDITESQCTKFTIDEQVTTTTTTTNDDGDIFSHRQMAQQESRARSQEQELAQTPE